MVIALIFGGALALIMGAITPAGGNIKLNQLINTPKEFQGKEFNILVTALTVRPPAICPQVRPMTPTSTTA